MKNKIKIISMIPARIGSERLKYKNLAILKGKPLISYVINASKKTKVIATSPTAIYLATKLLAMVT